MNSCAKEFDNLEDVNKVLKEHKLLILFKKNFKIWIEL